MNATGLKQRHADLSDMIHFTGKVDYAHAPLMLSAADIAVTPKLSPTEANGKIFNYMACGLPVVAFDTPVNREVLGDTGSLRHATEMPVIWQTKLLA